MAVAWTGGLGEGHENRVLNEKEERETEFNEFKQQKEQWLLELKEEFVRCWFLHLFFSGQAYSLIPR